MEQTETCVTKGYNNYRMIFYKRHAAERIRSSLSRQTKRT